MCPEMRQFTTSCCSAATRSTQHGKHVFRRPSNLLNCCLLHGMFRSLQLRARHRRSDHFGQEMRMRCMCSVLWGTISTWTRGLSIFAAFAAPSAQVTAAPRAVTSISVQIASCSDAEIQVLWLRANLVVQRLARMAGTATCAGASRRRSAKCRQVTQ